MTHDETVIERLFCEVGRARALTDEESIVLERIIRRRMARRTKPWTVKEDLRLKKLMRRTAAMDAALRFRPNGELRRIAAEFGRTYDACRYRIQVLRRREKNTSANGRGRG